MNDARAVAETFIATWNETDAARRSALLREHWCDGATFADPLAKVCGTAEVDALIAGVHARFPGFRFTLGNEPDGHGDYLRFAWRLGPIGAPAPIEGSDVIVMDGARIRQVISFFDKLPVAA